MLTLYCRSPSHDHEKEMQSSTGTRVCAAKLSAQLLVRSSALSPGFEMTFFGNPQLSSMASPLKVCNLMVDLSGSCTIPSPKFNLSGVG